MMINKSNYEAYLLDYLEGTISAQDREALLLFFELHPELKHELDSDISLNLTTQEQLTFNFKEQLIKHDADLYDLPINDYLTIKKQEEGLNSDEEAELILAEPDGKKREKEANDYQKSILKPDTSVIFGDKSHLRRFVLLPAFKQIIIQRSIAAVAIIGLFTSIWLTSDVPTIEQTPIANSAALKPNEQHHSIIVQSKILEKTLPDETQPSKDSLLKLAKDPMELKSKPVSEPKIESKKHSQYLASIGHTQPFKNHKINAYEHGLNVMMPQYMNNNLLRQELVSIYRKIEVEDNTPSLSLAIVESGVKVMNFLSKESVKMQKYYNDNGDVVAYKVKGENLEVNRKIK